MVSFCLYGKWFYKHFQRIINPVVFLSIRHISMLKITSQWRKICVLPYNRTRFQTLPFLEISGVGTWLPCNSGHCSKIPSMARNSPSCDITGMSSHWRHRQSNVCLINRAPKCLFWKQEIVIKKINFMGLNLIKRGNSYKNWLSLFIL